MIKLFAVSWYVLLLVLVVVWFVLTINHSYASALFAGLPFGGASHLFAKEIREWWQL